MRNFKKIFIGIVSVIVITISGLYLYNNSTDFNYSLKSTTTSFRHIDKTPKSKIHVYIRYGHSRRWFDKYLTTGKQSPEWPDGLKIYEGISNYELALDLVRKLSAADIEATLVNNYAYFDMSLADEVKIVNYEYAKDRRIILLDLHHNAQPTDKADYIDNYGQKGYLNSEYGATGIESFTSPGKTFSDSINNYYIIPELEKALPEFKFRYGKGTKGKEANFYVLSNSNCPAILIELGFMTTYTDCSKISNYKVRDAYTTAICAGFVKLNNDMNKK